MSAVAYNSYMSFLRLTLVFVAGRAAWAVALLLLAAASLSVSAAQEAGGTPRALDFRAAVDEASALPRLRSLLVSWRGELALEHYGRGARASSPANIKSASKSVISALVGIAIEQGYIDSVDQPIGDFFPDVLAGPENANRRAIRIEDLLTMRAGLETTSHRNYGAWVQSRNWVRHALLQPIVDAPGTRMEYSTGSSHLLSAILTRATGRSTWAFANDVLARPLGFTLAPWPRDPQGIYFGGNDMLMTPRQMVAFGEMYLARGQAGDTRVVPGSWVDRSFVPRTRSRWSDRLYGYGWWVRELAGHPVYYAWGYGGQFIFIVPSLQLVAVTTSSSAVSTDRRDHVSAIHDLVEQHVIPIVAAESD